MSKGGFWQLRMVGGADCFCFLAGGPDSCFFAGGDVGERVLPRDDTTLTDVLVTGVSVTMASAKGSVATPDCAASSFAQPRFEPARVVAAFDTLRPAGVLGALLQGGRVCIEVAGCAAACKACCFGVSPLTWIASSVSAAFNISGSNRARSS